MWGDCVNRTELLITQFYKSIKIVNPNHLSITNISDRLDLSVVYWGRSSAFVELDGVCKVLINSELNDRCKWQHFGHEMSHYFSDRNRSVSHKYYVDYCEAKAEYFSYHFCVPTFMLAELKGVDVYDIMNLFNVEFDFAIRRMEMYKSQIIRKGNNCVLFSEGTR